MFRKHRATILSTLFCAFLSIGAGIAWAWATGRRDIPPAAVIGLALAAGLATVALESFLERRRTRQQRVTPVHRHRKARAR